jgi:hypothetical protein
MYQTVQLGLSASINIVIRIQNVTVIQRLVVNELITILGVKLRFDAL